MAKFQVSFKALDLEFYFERRYFWVTLERHLTVFDQNQNLRNWFLIPLLDRFNILYFYRADKEITYTQKQTTRDFSLISIDLASRLSAEKREVSRKDSVKSLRRKIRGDESLSSSFLYGERNFRNIDCLVWLNVLYTSNEIKKSF